MTVTLPVEMPRRSIPTFSSEAVTPDASLALAIEALRGGEATRGFCLADRLCRVSHPNPQLLLLRAEASRDQGYIDYALADLENALALDPDNLFVNRRLLSWGTDALRLAAAHALIRLNDRETLRASLDELMAQGVQGAGSLRLVDQTILGWVAWPADAEADLAIVGEGGTTLTLSGQVHHPLADVFGQAAEIEVPVELGGWLEASVRVGHETMARLTVGTSGPVEIVYPSARDPADDTVTVIIPVYEDAEATQSCLQSVAACVEGDPTVRVVVVDDASPNSRVRASVDQLIGQPSFSVVRNARNVGFVHSVNQALSGVAAGDVILLNSDTIVPNDLVSRLKDVARSDPSIGTINPLTNSGELVSFPVPFKNSAFDPLHWREVDDVAARVNHGKAIDIPTGTGFCLYITRACLDEVGLLSERFDRGYLEDVDFCLRARDRGFRNVCAPSIYIAHHGSRSFLSGKGALVARNLKMLEQTAPGIDDECIAFMALDPLAGARQSIEREMPPAGKVRLLVGLRANEPALRHRARLLKVSGLASLFLFFELGPAMSARLQDSGDGIPQSLRIPFGSEHQDELKAYLARVDIDRIEMADVFKLPDEVVDLLVGCGTAVDALAMDVSPFVIGRRASANVLPPVHHDGDCAQRALEPTHSPADLRSAWKPVLRRCEKVIPLDAMASAVVGPLGASKVATLAATDHAGRRDHREEAPNVGIILPFETPAALQFVLALADRVGGSQDIFLLGRTSIDDRLLARGVFVVGSIEDVDRDRVMTQYAIGTCILPYRWDTYWALESYRAAVDVNAAFFDWSFGKISRLKDDLALEPRHCDRCAASAVADWLRDVPRAA